MRRSLVLALVVGASVPGVLAANVANAGAGSPAANTSSVKELNVKFGVHGFLVAVQGRVGIPGATLAIWRHGELAIYETKRAKFDDKSLSAEFGRFASIDLTFQSPPGDVANCGQTQGAFKGDFSFSGEQGYLSFDRHRVPGLLKTDVPCPGGPVWNPKTLNIAASLEVSTSGAPREGFDAQASLEPGKVPGLVEAARTEYREGVRIARGAQVSIGAKDFTWSLDEETATVRPPAPFSGSASFRHLPGGGTSLTGNLRVPILGGRPLFLTGPRFHAKLVKGISKKE